MSGIDAIYQDKILAYAADIPRLGKLEDATHKGHAVSRACGSEISVYLKVEDGRIADYAHKVDACALGSAAASIVARCIVGSSVEEVALARAQMEAMLKRDGPVPDGNFAELGVLQSARSLGNRHSSMLLALEASAKALKSEL
ncbi:iron-sulfur cluster assembly scaffold protein [Nisaea acidiphila]|uniref:Iron-sulfur cluster assembly scaffold protein n=1 Tax=Nisaea acidiphila TaxID=1862145 RepID=A0A9J7ANA3_9PROT|nr:iron-sulfur cluster assembly scaffold protein [Nisaea acidiphila]UUX48426.1 iron-sulfur cluster assembly scaffold protein [Nisaea acidiphila]